MKPTTNGDRPAAAPAAPRPDLRNARQARFAHSFANIIAVLMRDPGYRNLRLTDLEWLVLPAVMSGQWKLAQSAAPTAAGKSGAKPQGTLVVPVAVVLWASVSAQIDKRLATNLDKPPALKPNEWASGDNLWIIAIAGDPRAKPKFLKQLAMTEFKGRDVKLRAHDSAGKATVTTLAALAPPRTA